MAKKKQYDWEAKGMRIVRRMVGLTQKELAQKVDYEAKKKPLRVMKPRVPNVIMR